MTLTKEKHRKAQKRLNDMLGKTPLGTSGFNFGQMRNILLLKEYEDLTAQDIAQINIFCETKTSKLGDIFMWGNTIISAHNTRRSVFHVGSAKNDK